MKSWFLARGAAPAILLTSAWLVLADNYGFWRLVASLSDGGTAAGWAFRLSVFAFAVGVVSLLLNLLAWGRGTRWALGAVLVLSAGVAWFMGSYGVMLDPEMVRNVLETDRGEALELLSPSLALSVGLAGVLPAVVVWRLAPRRQRIGRMLLEKAVLLGLSLAVVTVAVAPFFKEYASMVRNHREIRYLLTPLNYLDSTRRLLADAADSPGVITPVGSDARRGELWAGTTRPVVTVLVVGETARADHFALNGYGRPTNPRLAEEDIVYFGQVAACGTSTAVSLPCMFSNLGKANYSKSDARSREGLLDVIEHAGIRTVWLDNNAGCKGVCTPSDNWTAAGLDIDGMCEGGECYDAVLLDRVRAELEAVGGDTVMVLHQNGSHGPAYFQRYPEAFRQFTPDCRSQELSDCTEQEIVNGYDNSILYTDWFLAQLIDLLDQRSADFDTALLYVSDHGESLGEYGLYLHGTPYFIAPEAQTHVPMLAWMSAEFESDFDIDAACLQDRRDDALSHDNFFHSVLGLLDIETSARAEELDLFAGCHAPAPDRLHAAKPAAPRSAGPAARH